jgi:hypothetical protein
VWTAGEAFPDIGRVKWFFLGGGQRESKFGFGEVLNYMKLLGHLYWYRVKRGLG